MNFKKIKPECLVLNDSNKSKIFQNLYRSLNTKMYPFSGDQINNSSIEKISISKKLTNTKVIL